MPLQFHKMHGAGNDFVLIDARVQRFDATTDRVRQIADRHLGIGCDQLLVLREAEDPRRVLRYEIWNADGTPAGQCGNGARCIGLYLEMSGSVADEAFTLESPAGTVEMRRCADGQYEVDMGEPRFGAREVPIAATPQDGRYRLESPWGPLEFGAASMGNPHALVVVDDIRQPDIGAMGAFLSTHAVFPDGCNAGFARLEGPERIRLRVIERGAGETLACGSGACAAMAILRRSGQVADVVEVLLPGGRLVIKWPGPGASLRMRGPARHVFRGTMNE
jgi:diaminopimelate epimerase